MKLFSQLPRFRAARAALAVLAQREAWSRGDIQAWQLKRLNSVWEVARATVPYYQSLSQKKQLPPRFDSLEEFVARIPILDKQSVRSEPEKFLSAQADPGEWHRTGGSTGTPMRIYWAKDAHLEMLRTKYRMLQTWDIDIFDRTAFLWGHAGSVAPGLAGLIDRIRTPLEDRARNRLRLSAYRLGEEDLAEHLKRLHRFRPKCLYGYSSAVGLLADHARQHEAAIDSLKLAIMTAEPADAALIRQVANGLQCDVGIEYGSVECGVMATTDREGKLRVREDRVLLETLQNELGSYDLVVTVLNNPSFPLIRYRIEDVAAEPIEAGGDGFAILPSVTGRQNDILVARSGRYVHSLAVKHVLEHYREIRRFRAHQNREGGLLVSVEASDTADLPWAKMQATLSGMLDGYPVTIELTERIAGNLAGKHRWVISDLVSMREAVPSPADQTGNTAE